jgi:hypothetical protein
MHIKKLAIVGSGPSTRDNAPWNDKDFTIWVLNEAATSEWVKRWDAVFQMHEPEIYQGHNTKDPNHWQFLQQKRDKPVYMQEVDNLVPDSVRYPLEEALELAEHKYLASTISYAIALGLLQDFQEIHVYGVELSMTEYQYQAECIRFWVGLAQGKLGKGRMVMHSGLHLFDAMLYGYEGNFAFGKEYFSERAQMFDGEWKSFESNAMNIKKAIERTIEKLDFNKLPELVSKYQVAMQNTGMTAGALAEAERYAAFGDRYADRGGFEFAAATAQRTGEEKRIMMLGRVGLLEYLGNAWMHYKNKEASSQLINQIDLYGKMAEDYGAYLGMYQENIVYIQKYDAMVQANGGLNGK